jgi:bleomycin hydrolase
MGSSLSRPASDPSTLASASDMGEKGCVPALESALSTIRLAAPRSGDGSLTLDNVSSWEASLSQDPKSELARTILSHSNIDVALSKRSTLVADVHVFNHQIDFTTGPITNQKNSGRCWLFATTNVLRYEIMKKLKLQDFQLSQVGVLCSFGNTVC